MRIPAAKPHIAHVVHELSVNAKTIHIFDMASKLQGYRHGVIFYDTPNTDNTALFTLMGFGIEVVGVDPKTTISPKHLETYQGAIFHNIAGHPGLGKTCPSVFYGYSGENPEISASANVVINPALTGNNVHISEYIPLGVPARMLKQYKADTDTFTVGIIDTGVNNKYPMNLVRHFLTYLPKDIRLVLSTPSKHREELMYLAKQRPENTILTPVTAQPDRRNIRRIDVLVRGYAPNYTSYYSKTAIEAMAMGIPVIYENKGYLSEHLIPKHHALSFEPGDSAQALQHVLTLQTDETQYNTLAANGKLWAMGNDQTVYMNQFNRLLKQIGI